MSHYWDADMSSPVYSSTDNPAQGLPSTILYSGDGGAPFAQRGGDEQPRMDQGTTVGTGYRQPLASATSSFPFESSQVLMPGIPRQHGLDAAMPPDSHLQDDDYMPPDVSPFRSSNSQQAPMNSLSAGFSVAHDLSHPRSIHQSASGPHTQQTPSPVANYDRNVPIDATPFALARFPLQNADHLQKRQSVLAIINSEWWIRHTIEPEERLLLQFMNYDQHEERWKCCFWEEGNPCQRSCKGKDHAKGHVRFHLQHFPFACEPPCPRNGQNCEKRYPTPGPLHKHRVAKVECPECGMSMLQGNLQRHQEGPCRGLSRLVNSSTNSPSFE